MSVKVVFVWLLSCLATAWIYWPGLSGPLLLDDTQNLMVLGALEEHPEYAWDSIFDNSSGVLGRSVSMTSFVAEKLWFDQGVFGVKRTNLILHFICAFLVFFLLYQWFSFSGWRYGKELAIFGGILWLVTPLFVSTVLYQVQRMAQLSTLFSLAALLTYGVWRQWYLAGRRHVFFLFLIVAFWGLGVFAKENAILVLPLILVVEYFWYAGYSADNLRMTILRRWHFRVFLLTLGLCAVFFFLRLDIIIDDYVNRDFTLLERLLTQTRALWHYCKQFFWPDVSILGVYHDDYSLSHSLIQPLSTAFSILGWLCVVVFALFSSSRLYWRKFVFGAVFYLVAHAVESSFVGLELYFEHRNYLPMVGILMVLLVVVGSIVQKLPETAPPILALGGFWLVVLVFKLSSQVQVWSSADLFYMASLNGHPDSIRANIEYSNMLARKKYLRQALIYLDKSERLRSDDHGGGRYMREMAAYCLAGEPYPIEKLNQFFISNEELRSPSFNNVLQFLVDKISRHRCDDSFGMVLAQRLANELMVRDVDSNHFTKTLMLAAQLDNSLGNYDRAMEYTKRVLLVRPMMVKVLLMHLHFAVAVNDEEQAMRTMERLKHLKSESRLDEHALYTLSLYTDPVDKNKRTE